MMVDFYDLFPPTRNRICHSLSPYEDGRRRNTRNKVSSVQTLPTNVFLFASFSELEMRLNRGFLALTSWRLSRYDNLSSVALKCVFLGVPASW